MRKNNEKQTEEKKEWKISESKCGDRKREESFASGPPTWFSAFQAQPSESRVSEEEGEEPCKQRLSGIRFLCGIRRVRAGFCETKSTAAGLEERRFKRMHSLNWFILLLRVHLALRNSCRLLQVETGERKRWQRSSKDRHEEVPRRLQKYEIVKKVYL